MKAVIQRVTSGSVTVEGEGTRAIGPGFVVLLGMRSGDTEKHTVWLAEKIANLRVFEDSEGKMNLSLLDVGGEALVISQFTLYADSRKGRRPSFADAAPPEIADALYRRFAELLQHAGVKVQTGWFGAKMMVSIENNGPVTLIIDTDGLV